MVLPPGRAPRGQWEPYGARPLRARARTSSAKQIESWDSLMLDMTAGGSSRLSTSSLCFSSSHSCCRTAA